MKRERSNRVAFIYSDGTFLGVYNYLCSLMAAMQKLSGHRLIPVVIAGNRSDAQTRFAGVEILRTSLLDRGSPSYLMRKAKCRILGWDRSLADFLLKHDIQVLSHSPHLGVQSVVATVGWIGDFQHMHFPTLFSAEELRRRDSAFMSLCLRSTKLIVSSNCALADLSKFCPNQAHKANVLQFVAPAPLDGAPSLEELQATYDFDSPFFLLPNQFWAHKNHRVVIEALRELRDKTPEIRILATGMTHDYRNPAFFDLLMEYAAECRVLDTFRVLGPIPYPHLMGLMQHSIAVINPSKFEGWSTTVEESKSMGKRIILSDIPVHREQKPSLGLFFNPDSHCELADMLVLTSKNFDVEADIEEQKKAASLLSSRQLEFGCVYERIVEEALAGIP